MLENGASELVMLPFQGQQIWCATFGGRNVTMKSMFGQPNPTTDSVRHRPQQLPVGVRWISRTPDQDALGLVLPATARPEGKAAERKKGLVKELAGGAAWRCDYQLGTLDPGEVDEVEEKISEIVGNVGD